MGGGWALWTLEAMGILSASAHCMSAWRAGRGLASGSRRLEMKLPAGRPPDCL